ncbi:DnaJ family molecular chaperone [Martelella sp. HB161492]|uniref:J domain-containing protein n=1 Tax=Martelella sp. HB161492 TaxID=2720726 RepID=UPI001592539B|nr:DnaJ family molecular chaperone [Martelella sp. HB161492]
MSFWEKLVNFVSQTVSSAGNVLASVVEAVHTLFEGDPETRRQVAFSVSLIALAAKMAKADGFVTEEEVVAFHEIFEIPEEERVNVARLYNLARQDIAGYDAYARKMRSLCTEGDGECPLLEEVIDGLFHIAKADGHVHDNELAFLADVASIFGISEARFAAITARHVSTGDRDPYSVLGVKRSDDFATIRSRYRNLAAENHPDRLMARGVPKEFHATANDRMARINAAYEAIERERRAA